MNFLAQNWWAFVLRGAAAIAFGVLAFIAPLQTLAVFVIVFSVFALADGVSAIVAAIRGRKTQERWWAMLLVGLLSIGAGVLAILVPWATVLAFVILVAVWATTIGALEIVAAIQLRKEIKGEWALMLMGVFGIACGVFLVVAPFSGAVALVWTIGAYSIAAGLLRLIVGIRLRRALTHPSRPREEDREAPGGLAAPA